MTDHAIRALVLRSAGTNCEDETARAFELAGAGADVLHLNALKADPARLADYRIIAIAGGFSYGDYVAAGRIFGIELRRHLLEPFQRFVEDGGLMIGICNGFQVLVELGLLQSPRPPARRTIALTDNHSDHYECRWVTLRAEKTVCPWLDEGWVFPCPLAHAEGRFVVADESVLDELEAQGQIALTYVDPAHAQRPARAADLPYPLNPNGSVANIAGICDPTGRILGLMPHPERNVLPWNHPQWTRLGERTEGEGLVFYRRMVEAAKDSVLATTS